MLRAKAYHSKSSPWRSQNRARCCPSHAFNCKARLSFGEQLKSGAECQDPGGLGRFVSPIRKCKKVKPALRPGTFRPKPLIVKHPSPILCKRSLSICCTIAVVSPSITAVATYPASQESRIQVPGLPFRPLFICFLLSLPTFELDLNQHGRFRR
jgi:hypothetical protein